MVKLNVPPAYGAGYATTLWTFTVPYFPERFDRAYTRQLENFARNVLDGREPPVTLADGIEALRVSLAATAACRTGQPVRVQSVVA